MKGIKISVVNGDALDEQADVLVLKYAQVSHGLTRTILNRMYDSGFGIDEQQLTPWSYIHSSSYEMTMTPWLLFIGVPPLGKFNYREIREFGRKSLVMLAEAAPQARKVLMTIHGPGYGLDEAEAFESQIAGLVDSIQSEEHPSQLEHIVFVERGRGRANRMKDVLKSLFPNGEIPTASEGGFRRMGRKSVNILRSAGYDSETKKRVFVAMPFADEFADLYDYGILGAVNAAGYLCERADMESFTGNIMEWVKDRIATADLVVADLSGANANVYLEVGYAWGRNRPTILLVNEAEQLKFDVRDQRCLTYSRIKELEEKLKNELMKLGV